MSEKGIRIPEEVSVVGFGDYEAGELLQPPLTTVKFDWEELGEISAESMIQMILGSR
ncbi:MAG: substrate-binding domain-containing protein [Dorea sp.]